MRKVISYAVLLLMMLMAMRTYARGLDMVLSPADQRIRGGADLTLDLYLHNTAQTAITHELPAETSCRIDAGQTAVNANARLVDLDSGRVIRIPAQEFVKRQYVLRLPVFATGPVRITMKALPTKPLIVTVEKAPPEVWAEGQVPLDEGPAMLQSFLGNFSVYNPMYFLLGVDPGLEQSKFQFSFKYRLFNKEGAWAKSLPWISDFYLAYSQLAIWDLSSDSKPFEDTSYMPEMFYLHPKINLNSDLFSAFGIQGGYQHYSNGKGGDDSRSTNWLYLKPIIWMPLAGPYQLILKPKIFTYLRNDDDTNPDLSDFIGYFDLQAEIVNPDGLALNTHLWWGKKGATVQLDLTYPMTRLLTKSLNLYLQAQYFGGYAETLINYNERNNAFRLGVAIVR